MAKLFSHPNTKRPTSMSQNRFSKAPVANITWTKWRQSGVDYKIKLKNKWNQ